MNDIAAIKKTQEAVELATEAVVSYISQTSRPTAERAHELIDEVLAEHNCEAPEGHMVAGGRTSAEPHEKGRGVLEVRVPIVIDIYPRSQQSGYFADMTRTVCIGTPPAELQGMYDAVLKAQELAITMVAPGVSCVAIQQAVENFFKEAGYATSGTGKEFRFSEGFVHSVGHGVGKELHQPPYFGREATDVLKAGDVVTIEPGLYYKHIGGVRLEDMILVTDSGHQNLSTFPKQLQVG